jgi:hypothetical protein
LTVTQYNDTFTAYVRLPSGTTIPVADASVNTTVFTPVTGIDFPGGDTTVGQSGWRVGKVDLSASQIGGSNTFQFIVADQGDAVHNSVALIDKIEVS